MSPRDRKDLFPGALEMMVLQTLQQQPMHGYALVQHIRRRSNDLLQVEEGSLYPALQRLLKDGRVKARWGVSASGRRVRTYEITPAGTKRLAPGDLELRAAARGHPARARPGAAMTWLGRLVRRRAPRARSRRRDAPAPRGARGGARRRRALAGRGPRRRPTGLRERHEARRGRPRRVALEPASKTSGPTSATPCASCGRRRRSLPRPCSRWPSASAPTRRSSASCAPCCCGRCRSPRSDRLVAVQSLDMRGGPHPTDLSYPTFFDFRRARVFAGLASFRDEQFTLTDGDGAAGHPRAQSSRRTCSTCSACGPRSAAASTWPRNGPVAAWSSSPTGSGSRSSAGTARSSGARSASTANRTWSSAWRPPGSRSRSARGPIDIWTTLSRDASSATVQPMTEQRGARLLERYRPARRGPTRSSAHASGSTPWPARLRASTRTRTATCPARRSCRELRWVLGDMRAADARCSGARWRSSCSSPAPTSPTCCSRAPPTASARSASGWPSAGRAGGSSASCSPRTSSSRVAGSAVGLVVARLLLFVFLPVALERVPRAGEVTLDAGVIAMAVALALLTAGIVSLPLARRIGRIDFNGGLRASPRGAPPATGRAGSWSSPRWRWGSSS